MPKSEMKHTQHDNSTNEVEKKSLAFQLINLQLKWHTKAIFLQAGACGKFHSYLKMITFLVELDTFLRNCTLF